VLLYARRDPPKDDADRAEIDKTIDFLRDVTHDEDYLVGLEIQKGLKARAHDSIILGRNERGNQFFHETLQWYMDGKEGPAPTIR
jgi:hypothetical protein